jgi:hypothetical protein
MKFNLITHAWSWTLNGAVAFVMLAIQLLSVIMIDAASAETWIVKRGVGQNSNVYFQSGQKTVEVHKWHLLWQEH